jgi:hypothetical protein
VIVNGDVKDFGKHFLIRSLNNRTIYRQYTVTQCLEPKVYTEYLSLIDQFKKGARDANLICNQKKLETTNKKKIVITVKNYGIIGGLSH